MRGHVRPPEAWNGEHYPEGSSSTGKSKHPRVLACACRQWQMTGTSPPPHVASRRRLDVLCSPVHMFPILVFRQHLNWHLGRQTSCGVVQLIPSISGAVTTERQGSSCSMLNGVITNRILPGTKREYSSSDFTCCGLHLEQDQAMSKTSTPLMHLDALQSKNHA